MFYRFVLLLFSVVGLAGCGPSLGKVSGVVTVNDEPKANLVVSFTPTGGGVSASAITGENGSYVVTSTLGNGIPPGSYRVKISTLKSAINSDDAYTQEPLAEGAYGDRARAAMEEPKKEYNEGLKAYRGAKEPIPAKYNSDSTLVEEIKGGSQTLDFKLEV